MPVTASQQAGLEQTDFTRKKNKKTSLKIFKHYKLKPSFSIIKDEKEKDKIGAHSTSWGKKNSKPNFLI